MVTKWAPEGVRWRVGLGFWWAKMFCEKLLWVVFGKGFGDEMGARGRPF